MSAPGSQGYTEIGNGVEGSEPEAVGAPHPGPIPGALFRAEELPLYTTQIPGTLCGD